MADVDAFKSDCKEKKVFFGGLVKFKERLLREIRNT